LLSEPEGSPVHEDLLNAVSNLVHRHLLVTLHAMIGAMLAQLDAGGEVDLGGKAPTPEPTKPAVAAPSPKLSTLERKQRRQRAKQRQAANGATAPVTAEETPGRRCAASFMPRSRAGI
jgi:hypothetical protein